MKCLERAVHTDMDLVYTPSSQQKTVFATSPCVFVGVKLGVQVLPCLQPDQSGLTDWLEAVLVKH